MMMTLQIQWQKTKKDKNRHALQQERLTESWVTVSVVSNETQVGSLAAVSVLVCV